MVCNQLTIGLVACGIGGYVIGEVMTRNNISKRMQICSGISLFLFGVAIIVFRRAS